MSKERIAAIIPIEEQLSPHLVCTYDIDNILKDKTEDKWGFVGNKEWIIIEGPKGIIISDNEAVHHIFPGRDYEVKLHVVEKQEGVTSLFPSHSLPVKIGELMECPHKEKELGQAVRRFGGRIEANYLTLLKSIKEIGLNSNDYPRGYIKKEPKGKRRIANVR
jgi:hypothetical protein